MNISITVKIDNEQYTTNITSEESIPEYMIADEAWRLACLYARTKAIAATGTSPSSYELSKFLEKVEYTYSFNND